MSTATNGKLVEFEGYMRSKEFVSNALGLRKAIAEMSGTDSYTGNAMNALLTVSEVPLEPRRILSDAREHLCAHVMTAGDVQAHYLMADIQEQMIVDELARLQVLRQCEASVGGGENPPQCPRAATNGRYCAEHYEE